MSKKTRTNVICLESLEGRQLLSAASHHAYHAHHAADVPAGAQTLMNGPLGISQIAANGGMELLVTGTTGSDQVAIAQSGTTYTVRNGAWSKTVTGLFKTLVVQGNGGNDSITLDPTVTTDAVLYGGAGNDTLVGSNANDTFYAGGGNNVLKGGAGRDVFVTLGSKADAVSGGGNAADSFWMDDSKSEVVTDLTRAQVAAGSMHRIGTFLNGASKVLAGQSVADPATTESDITYKNFSTSPLFADAGPAENDIKQGYIGDCYFVATLSSVAKLNPNRIRQSVVDLGDGTYAVQMSENGSKVFVRVNADLPVWSGGGTLAYADFGAQNSIWVGIMEKAFTYVRNGANPSAPAYATIDNGGWMDEAYSALSTMATDVWSAASADAFYQLIAAKVTAGKSVTIGIQRVPAGAPLIANHAYVVDHVGHDASGNATLTFRNPWGVDGAGNDGSDDGYVTVSAQQAFQAFSGLMYAAV